MPSLSEKLSNGVYPTDPLDSGWVQYVRDHRNHILRSSRTITIPADILHSSKYRIHELLEKIGEDVAMGWIVLWLSEISSNAELEGISELTIPSSQTINTLYASYATSRLRR